MSDMEVKGNSPKLSIYLVICPLMTSPSVGGLHVERESLQGSLDGGMPFAIIYTLVNVYIAIEHKKFNMAHRKFVDLPWFTHKNPGDVP